MCTNDTWPYWIELAVGVIGLIGAFVVAYGSRDPTRQQKFWLAAFIYGLTAVVAGSLALGQMHLEYQPQFSLHNGCRPQKRRRI